MGRRFVFPFCLLVVRLMMAFQCSHCPLLLCVLLLLCVVLFRYTRVITQLDEVLEDLSHGGLGCFAEQNLKRGTTFQSDHIVFDKVGLICLLLLGCLFLWRVFRDVTNKSWTS